MAACEVSAQRRAHSQSGFQQRLQLVSLDEERCARNICFFFWKILLLLIIWCKEPEVRVALVVAVSLCLSIFHAQNVTAQSCPGSPASPHKQCDCQMRDDCCTVYIRGVLHTIPTTQYPTCYEPHSGGHSGANEISCWCTSEWEVTTTTCDVTYFSCLNIPPCNLCQWPTYSEAWSQIAPCADESCHDHISGATLSYGDFCN